MVGGKGGAWGWFTEKGERAEYGLWLLWLTGAGQTQAIDDAYRIVSNCDDAEKRDEGKKIVEELARLKYEVQHDRALT